MAKTDIATAKQEILDWLHEGGSILGYCRQEGKPKRRTIYDWAETDPEFGAQFARAREAGAGALIDQAQDIADDGINDTYTAEDGSERTNHDVIARSKLRVDTLFKRAACYCPRLYGTKVALGGDPSAPPIKVENQGPAVPPLTDYPDPSTGKMLPGLLAGIRKLGELAEELLPGDDA